VNTPTLATLHYRFVPIDESRLQAFNQWLAQQVIGTEQVEIVLVDGLWAQEMYERFCNVGMVVCFLCVW